MNKVILSYPLTINGVEIKELEYDFSTFTVDDYLKAVSSKRPGKPGDIAMQINDYALHHSLGVAVILNSNKEKGWSAEDFDRLRGNDIWKISEVGLSFFASPDDVPQENNSGEPSEDIPKDSTQRAEK